MIVDCFAEEWRECPVYGEQYEISNQGRVRKRRTGKILSQQTDNKGYKRVRLSLHDKKASGKVHRLVAIAFIPNPNNKPQVNHKDADKTNNAVSNLEWVTNGENQIHAYKNGLNYVTGRAGRKRIRVKQIDMDGNEIHVFSSLNDASASTGANSVNISSVLRHKRKTAGGYRWEVV